MLIIMTLYHKVICWLQRISSCKAAHTTEMRTRKSGQAMIEYAITAGILLSLLGVMSLFLYIFNEHGDRVLKLAASDYP